MRQKTLTAVSLSTLRMLQLVETPGSSVLDEPESKHHPPDCRHPNMRTCDEKGFFVIVSQCCYVVRHRQTPALWCLAGRQPGSTSDARQPKCGGMRWNINTRVLMFRFDCQKRQCNVNVGTLVGAGRSLCITDATVTRQRRTCCLSGHAECY